MDGDASIEIDFEIADTNSDISEFQDARDSYLPIGARGGTAACFTRLGSTPIYNGGFTEGKTILSHHESGNGSIRRVGRVDRTFETYLRKRDVGVIDSDDFLGVVTGGVILDQNAIRICDEHIRISGIK